MSYFADYLKLRTAQQQGPEALKQARYDIMFRDGSYRTKGDWQQYVNPLNIAIRHDTKEEYYKVTAKAMGETLWAFKHGWVKGTSVMFTQLGNMISKEELLF